MTTEYTVNAALLKERYHAVCEQVAAAARASGRSENSVKLVAVSKLHPLQAIEILAEEGHRVFGESYVQEALEKQNACVNSDVEWHFIGGLQSKKAKDVVGRFSLIHSVDRLKLAQNMQNRMAMLPAETLDGEPVRQNILIQVNIAGEAQKSGVEADALDALIEEVLTMDRLTVRGLMCMPPFTEIGEAARPYFAKLRQMRDALEVRFGIRLPELSMGMSQDFVQAIDEGATYVRVGTDIFGERHY